MLKVMHYVHTSKTVGLMEGPLYQLSLQKPLHMLSCLTYTGISKLQLVFVSIAFFCCFHPNAAKNKSDPTSEYEPASVAVKTTIATVLTVIER